MSHRVMVEMPDRLRRSRVFAHACLVLCLLVVAAPVLLVEYPPIFDYANHLARVQVIASLDRSAIFQAHFQTPSFLIPNVLADLLVLALMPLGGVLVAGKALLLLTFALTLTGAYALNHQLTGQYSPWPLLSAAFLYNEGFFWGFLNYNLGLGLMLWGLAAWVAMQHRPTLLRMVVGTAFALAVFFAHLVAFGLYAVAVAVIELRRAWLERTLAHLTMAAAPFMLPLAVFVGLSPSGELELFAMFDFSIPGKIMPFARVLSSGNPLLDFATLAALGGALAVALLSGLATIHGALALVAAVFLLLVLTLPFSMLGSFFLDSRIVVAVALVFLAGLTPRHGMPAAWVSLVVLALMGGRSYGLMEDWRLQDDDYAAVIATLDKVPPGSVIVTAVGHPFELGDWVTTRRVKPSHEHTTLYATIRNSVLVPNIFARPGQNPLVFRASLPALDRAARNPVARIFHSNDARWMVGEMLPLADTANTITPPIPGVFVIGYHVPCAWWPVDMPIRAIACEPTYSLIEILGGVEEPIP